MDVMIHNFFLDWTLQLDKYFTWYNLTELRKIKFAAMKLSGQASQYWANLENIRVFWIKWPIEIWYMMKDEMKGKIVQPSFGDHLMDKWHQYIQGNKSAKEYVVKLNESLIRCSTFSKERQAQIISKFRAILREDLQTKLLVRGVTELEKACIIVQDLDSLRSNYNTRSFDSKWSVIRTFSSS